MDGQGLRKDYGMREGRSKSEKFNAVVRIYPIYTELFRFLVGSFGVFYSKRDTHASTE